MKNLSSEILLERGIQDGIMYGIDQILNFNLTNSDEFEKFSFRVFFKFEDDVLLMEILRDLKTKAGNC